MPEPEVNARPAANPLPMNPVKSGLAWLIGADLVGIPLGVLIIVFVENALIPGLAVILLSSFLGGGMFIYKLVRVDCPSCRNPLSRDAQTGRYVCARCRKEWSTSCHPYSRS